ncbi:hypothetical protein FA10DRAFT_142657 [Acaromyces ingoldii]|uniref:Uncharacterized protein n=1 Tax=Acaromyces ingoldii TaxID=215250 RepID=A0A316YKM0_9BASI|nr:hypothetical protein FA10DRAFT_142657 [Acaromyces ingoldii]PWN89354.1 hypothetical protein FA10DRAFT_142657 [Acaromyces ingoldii]
MRKCEAKEEISRREVDGYDERWLKRDEKRKRESARDGERGRGRLWRVRAVPFVPFVQADSVGGCGLLFFLGGNKAVVMLSPLRVVRLSVHTAAHRLQRKSSLRAILPLKESNRVDLRGRVRTRVSVCGCISKGHTSQERERGTES